MTISVDHPLHGTHLEATLEAHRVELTGYCYRMLGAASEAEDAVQETLVRAWKAADRFEGRSSARARGCTASPTTSASTCTGARNVVPGPWTWVRPATRQRSCWARPHAEQTFVQPVADALVIDVHGDPADIVAARESIRLAFVAALQHLPARQRSVLILCEVLRWQATEVADLLDTTVASVNSALQRARATLATLQGEQLDTTLSHEHEQLLARYLDAFERYDVDEIATLLRDDVVLSMPPYDTWLVGPDGCRCVVPGPGHRLQGGSAGAGRS